MANLNTVEQSAGQRILLVGLPGSGKSTLAAMLAEWYKLDWIDVENGKATLFKLPTAVKENINLIQIPDSATFPVASATLMSLFKNNKADICIEHGKDACATCKKDGKPFDSIDFNNYTARNICVIDTITQVSHSVLAHQMKGKSVDTKPERDDWGALRKFTEYFCSQWQAVPFNLICIAHIMEAELENGKSKLVGNFGSANMSAEIGKAFDHIIYCDTVNGKHKAYSSSTHSASIMTKSRTGFRIEDLTEPSLKNLFAPPSDIRIYPEVAAGVSAAAKSVVPGSPGAAAVAALAKLGGK